MSYAVFMHRTTMNLPDDLFVRLRSLGARAGKPVGQVAVELIEEALTARGGSFESHGSGSAEVDDLGINSERYLREGLA